MSNTLTAYIEAQAEMARDDAQALADIITRTVDTLAATTEDERTFDAVLDLVADWFDAVLEARGLG